MAICNLQSPCYECFFWQLATCHGSAIPGYPRCLVPAEKVVSMHRHNTCRGIDHIQLASTASWGSARSWERWQFDTLPFMLGSRSAGVQGCILGYDMLVPKILELLPKKTLMAQGNTIAILRFPLFSHESKEAASDPACPLQHPFAITGGSL